jgi:hypothetical protein
MAIANWALISAFVAVGVAGACGGTAIIDPPLDGAGGATSSTVAATSCYGVTSQVGSGTTTSTVTASQSASTAVSQVAATSSGSGGSKTCDVGDCGDCLNSDCAYTVCQSSYDACFNNGGCVSFIDCVSSCQSEECFGTCESSFPGGAELYFGLIDCAMCTPNACFKDCDGAAQCGP